MGSSSLAGLIDRCIADAEAYYVLTFTPLRPPIQRVPRHQVQLDRPGLQGAHTLRILHTSGNNEQPLLQSPS